MNLIYAEESKQAAARLSERIAAGRVEQAEMCGVMISLYETLAAIHPEEAQWQAKLAEAYHLDGQLRRAGVSYRAALAMEPARTPTEREKAAMLRHCPLLRTTKTEYFPLKDVAVIHHPDVPLIGYHLFWEDDYDFPDDCEPSDHEEVWVEYDPATETVTGVMSFFHSSVIASEEAVREAEANGGRPIIRVEWGKHGSLLKGWETMRIPGKDVTMQEWMRSTFDSLQAGGRLPNHPLKQYWPDGYEGDFTSYLTFTEEIDPLHHLARKPLLFNGSQANAILFCQAVPYNFHPKMEWPDRFYAAVKEK